MLNANLEQAKHYHRNLKPALAGFFSLIESQFIFLSLQPFWAQNYRANKGLVGLGMLVRTENSFPDGAANVVFKEDTADSKMSFQAM